MIDVPVTNAPSRSTRIVEVLGEPIEIRPIMGADFAA